MLRRMPELGFHAAQNVIDVSAVVALSLCKILKFLLIDLDSGKIKTYPHLDNHLDCCDATFMAPGFSSLSLFSV